MKRSIPCTRSTWTSGTGEGDFAQQRNLGPCTRRSGRFTTASAGLIHIASRYSNIRPVLPESIHFTTAEELAAARGRSARRENLVCAEHLGGIHHRDRRDSLDGKAARRPGRTTTTGRLPIRPAASGFGHQPSAARPDCQRWRLLLTKTLPLGRAADVNGCDYRLSAGRTPNAGPRTARIAPARVAGLSAGATAASVNPACACSFFARPTLQRTPAAFGLRRCARRAAAGTSRCFRITCRRCKKSRATPTVDRRGA